MKAKNKAKAVLQFWFGLMITKKKKKEWKRESTMTKETYWSVFAAYVKLWNSNLIHHTFFTCFHSVFRLKSLRHTFFSLFYFLQYWRRTTNSSLLNLSEPVHKEFFILLNLTEWNKNHVCQSEIFSKINCISMPPISVVRNIEFFFLRIANAYILFFSMNGIKWIPLNFFSVRLVADIDQIRVNCELNWGPMNWSCTRVLTSFFQPSH